MQKQCNRCNQVKDISNFTKNKNNKDGYSYYCKDCTKKQQYLSAINKQYKNNDELIIELLKKKNIPIDGLDKNKVINTRIQMYDLPNMLEPIWKTLPSFLIKYNWTYDEYKFFISQCKKNKFYII
jgi:hypothetical protein